MIAADRAEARGDAAGAWEVIERDLGLHGSDPPFWRPGRIERLLQLQALGPWLPRWATSRWILDQAVQHLDPHGHDRAHRALRIAEATGGMRDVCDGLGAFEARVRLLDHDWVHRQLLLYELGGLRAFLAHGAAAHLVDAADQIRAWASAPLAAFRLVATTARTTTWLELASGTEHECLEIGAASLLAEGDHVIGRMVPVEQGTMFESAPLWVPVDVAGQVAQDRSCWWDAVRAGCATGRAEPISTYRSGFPLLTDVDPWHQTVCAVSLLDGSPLGEDHGQPATPVVAVGMALVRAALDDKLPASEGIWRRPAPIVAATLLSPSVLVELFRRAHPVDAPRFERLAEQVPEPAAALCRDLALLAESAA